MHTINLKYYINYIIILYKNIVTNNIHKQNPLLIQFFMDNEYSRLAENLINDGDIKYRYLFYNSNDIWYNLILKLKLRVWL